MGDIEAECRITVHHKNLPNMIGQLTSALAEEGYNIENMLNKSKKDYTYSIFDVEKRPSEKVLSKMKQIDGVIRLRVL